MISAHLPKRTNVSARCIPVNPIIPEYTHKILAVRRYGWYNPISDVLHSDRWVPAWEPAA
jgi:hypothetical protein